MNLPQGDMIRLVYRGDVVGLIGRELTRAEWTKAKRIIMGDKALWECVDSALMMIVDEIGGVKI